jgi:hypothetical protein
LEYFFPQINDGYWQKDGMTEKCDKLVITALDDEDLHYLIETTSCIPAQSSEVMNKPSDLVLENGLLGDIEVLALEKFSKTSIGMSMTTTPQSLLTVNRKSSAI